MRLITSNAYISPEGSSEDTKNRFGGEEYLRVYVNDDTKKRLNQTFY